jgi:hypothetical protein
MKKDHHAPLTPALAAGVFPPPIGYLQPRPVAPPAPVVVEPTILTMQEATDVIAERLKIRHDRAYALAGSICFVPTTVRIPNFGVCKTVGVDSVTLEANLPYWAALQAVAK